ncbi:unnamed protein product [Rotaria socialis]|uniref:Uncharacterized protein n=1 Tax=Rotaria socialis TaxID=392032 RepID=A0A820TAW4_9BILA|nr:unnamed protein product [Rotaria socialis]CAF4468181.1 unnamed protein product [Rotaria socialis]
MTRCQIAEIQLEAILNEPKSIRSLPIRGLKDVIKKNKRYTIEQVSKMLNTLSGMTKRLLAALGMPSENDDAPTLSTRDVQNITRVLNSTTDVRVLLLFKMVSGVDNVYVDQEGLTQLFEHYPRNVGTFAQDQYPEFFRVLLRKFQLNERSRIVFGEFYAIVLDDPDALESLSRFTVHPDWCVGPSKQTSEPNVAENFLLSAYLTNKKEKKCTKEYTCKNLSRIII